MENYMNKCGSCRYLDLDGEKVYGKFRCTERNSYFVAWETARGCSRYQYDSYGHSDDKVERARERLG